MHQPSSVYGQDLYEVLLADYPARTAWDHLPSHMRLIYEKAAQALNVRLGLIPATFQDILIVHEHSIVPVRGVAGLASYIDRHLVPHDRFEAHLVENGLEVGYGWYEIAENGHLIVYEERGKAREHDEQMGLSLSECVAVEPMNPKGVRR